MASSLVAVVSNLSGLARATLRQSAPPPPRSPSRCGILFGYGFSACYLMKYQANSVNTLVNMSPLLKHL
ncbi:hypothetical protein OPV22_001038 [Ensete ventricosum]|uniref:Uncharacterized protein n=1 Tax=Ensete ventricosum TaxID=4639 RepID=A0AAV8RKH0_ENSVE|nr:hypothetical protein OPV22_001038 [Ensete ventricosum]